jgi:hypothetical protein
LYHDNGNLELAIGTLKASRRLCSEHGLEFDWDDVLSEYVEEQTANVSQIKAASK